MSIQEYQLSEKVRGKLNGDFVEIIDNLTEGGANKALSAEQGKVIKAFVDKNAKDILDELSRKATSTTLGNVMVDGTSIVVDANGKISSTATGGGTIIIDDTTTGGRDSAWSAEQGKILNDFVMAETMKLVDIYDGLDSNAQNKVLSALQGKVLNDKITAVSDILNIIDIPQTDNIFSPATVKSGVYGTELSGIDGLLDGWYIITLNVNVSEVDNSIVRFWTASRMIMDEQNNKIIVDKLYHGADMINQNTIIYETVWTEIGKSGNSSGLDGSVPTVFTSIFKPTYHTSGVYRGTVPVDNGVDPIDEDMNLPMGDYTVTVNVTAIPTGGFIKNYTAMKTGIETQGAGKYATFIYELLHREDRIDSTGNVYSAQGKWNIFTPSSYATLRQEHGQLKTDVQTLFTNWANETTNAVTALSHKGVTLAPDATMKEVVAGIESISTAKKTKVIKNAGSGASGSFNYVGGGAVNMQYVPVNLSPTVLGFSKPSFIIVNSAGFDGQSTIVQLDTEDMVSARVVNGATTGTCKWLRLSSSGYPTNVMNVPVNSMGGWDITIHEA